MLRPAQIALLLMLGSTIAIACMHSLVRMVGEQLHPFVVVFFRNLFGLIVLLPLFIRGGTATLKTNSTRLYVLRAIIGVLAMSSWFYALTKVELTNATAISFSTSLFATLSAWLFLGETMRIRRWAAIIVGMIGIVVVLRPDPSGFNYYALLVLVSAIAWGASITIAKRLSQTDRVITIVGWMGISLTLLSLPPAIIYWQAPDTMQLIWLALIGALATTGHWLMTTALKLADTAVVMSMDFMRLVWTALIAAWLFGEYLDIWTVVGAVIIFTAAWYVIFRESQLDVQSSKTGDISV